MQKNSEIIALQEVSVSFGDLIVHRDISFSVSAGESLTLLGPSGIGKTLILKMIIGILRPTSGRVSVLNQELNALEEQELRIIRRDIGMLFQGAALFDSLTVYENIAYPLREAGSRSEEEIAAIVNERLALVGLPGLGHKYPTQLSGGQKKRIGLARALANSPRILLFDEPTTGLDPTATRLIDELIIKLNQEFGITAVSVTHDIESAKRISGRWLLINNGRVVADGSPSQIALSNNEVRDFINGNWKSEVYCQ